MATITKEEVLKIAHMSRIAIHEHEIDAITGHLQAVLDYAARVNEIATGAQMAQTNTKNVFREDIVVPYDAPSIKAQAPEIEADYFVVPAILEQE